MRWPRSTRSVLGATVLRALAERNDLDTGDVDDIVWGTSMQVGTQGGDLGRMAALDAGYDITASGVTLDRFCGSGISSVNLAAASVMSGMEDVVIAGGTEMMSSYAANAARSRSPFLDSGNMHLRGHPPADATRASPPTPSPRWRRSTAGPSTSWRLSRSAGPTIAIKEGRFDQSLVPVYHLDGTLALDHEEYPRPGTTTADSLAWLPASFEATGRHPARRDGHDLPHLVLQKFPGLEITTCTTPATRRASSTARPRC